MKPQTEITDFRQVLELVVADGKSIMIGGHAVNFWALFYLPRIEKELRQFMPFTSKDLDFYGDSHLLEKLIKRFGGVKRMSQPRGPVIGQVELEIDGAKRVVEVLHSVHGLSQKELGKALSPKSLLGRFKQGFNQPANDVQDEKKSDDRGYFFNQT